MSYETLLVAIDVNDPDNAKAALRGVRDLIGGDLAASKVIILYVRHYLPTRYAEMLSSDFDLREREEAEILIREWAVYQGLDRIEIVTRRGRVRDEVIGEAKKRGADVIVIGSHQPTITTRLLGSNASAIIRDSPISVLVVRGEGGEG